VKLDAVDSKMREVCKYSTIHGKMMDGRAHERLCWKGIRCGGCDIVMKIVLEDSTVPTELMFFKNDVSSRR
jgi:hypothetical protein